jgi:hypothetical protein
LTLRALDALQGTGGILVNAIREWLRETRRIKERDEARRRRQAQRDAESREHSAYLRREDETAKAIIREHTPDENRAAWERVKADPVRGRWLKGDETDGIPPGYVVAVALELDAEGFQKRMEAGSETGQ